MDTDQAAPPTATRVVVGPGLPSAATQIALDKNPNNPVAAVDRTLLEEAGVKTHGWLHAGNTWWREHSNWVWGAVVAVDSGVAMLQPALPPTWTRGAAVLSAIGGVAGMILKYRVQITVAIARVQGEVQRNTQ